MHASGKRILLVEDDRYLRLACAAGLKRAGFAVLTAEDGEQALTVARAERPDLILLDMLMPKLSGIEVLRTLKAEEPTRAIPVLVLSNSSRERDVEEAMRLGAVGYWVKSNLSLEELTRRVAALF